MKSELTQQIERLLKYYDPADLDGIKINRLRPRHIFYEFPVECGTTTSGLVDAMGISEYFYTLGSHTGCRWPEISVRDQCKMGIPVGQKAPEVCTAKKCPCQITYYETEPRILFVCYEIKISRRDFLSKNGHNFHGNLNYYVMPKELWDKCKTDISDGIGVIAMSAKKTLRRVKSSKFRKLTPEQEKWYLMTALKKGR